MARESNLSNRTFIAGSDLSSDQYKFVTLAADGQIDVAASAGSLADGVLQNDPALAGRSATVAVGGRTKITASATIAIGANISTTAAGLAVTSSSGQYILGTACTGGAVNEVITMEFDRSGRVA